MLFGLTKRERLALALLALVFALALLVPLLLRR
jgi:hypothetical protein